MSNGEYSKVSPAPEDDEDDEPDELSNADLLKEFSKPTGITESHDWLWSKALWREVHTHTPAHERTALCL